MTDIELNKARRAWLEAAQVRWLAARLRAGEMEAMADVAYSVWGERQRPTKAKAIPLATWLHATPGVKA